MSELPYWNHNTAYYPWIRKKTDGCRLVLDVGCGDGLLISYLRAPERVLVGVDPFPDCIRTARENRASPDVRFECIPFEAFAPEAPFDAVLFSASLHHMETESALAKAVSLLAPGGRLIVVGLAEPSSTADHLIEALRVLPSYVVSRLCRISPCEERGVPVSFSLPPMKDVRRAAKKLLPGAKLRYGLHYRYLLEWKKSV